MRLIDADAFLVDSIKEKRFAFSMADALNGEFVVKTVYSDLAEALANTPTIDAVEVVRHGYWIPQDNTRTKFMCSDCNSRNHDGSGKYCSRCGCKMDANAREEMRKWRMVHYADLVDWDAIARGGA